MNHLPKLSAGILRNAGVDSSQFRRRIEASISFPFHGKYCGPGHGPSDGCTPPDDEVDAVCCRHDACYSQLGTHDCRCDLQLLLEINTGIAKEALSGNIDAVAKGEVIKALFLAKPCKCEVFGVPIWLNPFLCLRAPARMV